jgi:hypothetical protein
MNVAATIALPSLYVAYSTRSHEVRWFEAEPELAEDLADDLTQVDADGIRRAYRRLDGLWFAFLADRAKPEQWAPIRARMIELRGAELVRKAEAWPISHDYILPQLHP